MCSLVVETTSIFIAQAPTCTPQTAGLALSIGHGWGIFRRTSPHSPRTFGVDREPRFQEKLHTEIHENLARVRGGADFTANMPCLVAFIKVRRNRPLAPLIEGRVR